MAATDSTPPPDPRVHPPAYMRIAVLVGLAVLVIGLSGLFWLKRRPANPAFVRVPGVAAEIESGADVFFEVEAMWEDGEGELRGEAGTAGREPDVWLFYDAPKATEVTLVVYRLTEVEREEIARRTQPLERGKLLTLPMQR